MIPKTNRLKKNKQFSFIYKHGQTKHTSLLSLSFVKTKFKPYKIGFTVSKKIGKSVIRSKVKRRLREAFRAIMPFVNINYNYIVIARPEIASATFDEIKCALISVLKKAGLYLDGNLLDENV